MTVTFTYKSKAVSLLGYYFMQVLASTLRWDRRDYSGIQWESANPCVFACWHSDILMVPFCTPVLLRNIRNRPIAALASGHRDGRMIAGILSHFSFDDVVGSSSNNATDAILKMKRLLKKGTHVAMTPDGPKGPARVAKHGALFLAASCGVPIIPIVVGSQRKWTFKSWDRFFIPKPWGKLVIIVGAPFEVPANLDRSLYPGYVDSLSNYLNQLKSEADTIACS
jgi:lysophospholipid acyltransferase (LPLAT)-like uncharacterized protein